jgi:mono/diheme cytochrome c family protein
MKATAQFLALGCASAALLGLVALVPPGESQTAAAASAQRYQQIVGQYCVACHNSTANVANLAIDKLDFNDLSQHGEKWEKVVRKLRTGMMPPAGMPRPDRATMDALAAYLESGLDRAAAAAPDPGAPSLHRLNRTEYANSVRDLLALDVDVATLLPADDSAEGFDNIADVLSVSPSLVQGYVAAAMKISRAAIGDRTMLPTRVNYPAPAGLSQAGHIEGLPLGTRGGFVFTHTFPLDAEYEFQIAGGGRGTAPAPANAGGGRPPGGPPGAGGPPAAGPPAAGPPAAGPPAGGAPQAAAAGGRPQAGAAAAGGAAAGGAAAGGGGRGGGGPGGAPAGNTITVITMDGKPVDVVSARSFKLRVPAGPHKFAISVLDRSNTAGVDDLHSTAQRAAGISGALIIGPNQPTGAGDTPSRRKIFTCQPKSAAEETPCARKLLTNLATQAFRRPVAESDPSIETLMSFYEAGRKEGDFETGVQQALARLLVDPRFIFRFEEEPASVKPGAVYRISDHELASRLSFFLWSTIPDAELIDVAKKNKLHEPRVLEAQVRRMLADPRSDEFIENFAGQWLNLRALDGVQPESREWNGNLRQGFRRETEMLFETIVREDRSIVDVIDADFTFVDEQLAKHYGIPGVKGSYVRRVSLPADSPRRGLLGQGSFLTTTSVANRTSPVVRGAWVLENLLGAPPPKPPPGVETNLDAKDAKQPDSLRARLEQHRANAVCATCHNIMDPVGLSLEPFDLIGKWRDKDNGIPIDASGVMVDGTKLAGPNDLRKVLLDRKDIFAEVAIGKLLTYAVGRPVEHKDMPTVRKIAHDAKANGYKMSSLVLGVVNSAPFQMRVKHPERIEASAAPAGGGQ